jgi:phosphinothricin acetyltransferase
MRGAAGKDQVVEWKRTDVRSHHFLIEVDRLDLSQQHTNIRISRQHASNRRGNFGGTEAGHRHLIEKRLKQVMVPLIDQRDVDVVNSSESLRGIDACKSASDYDDSFHATPLRDIMPHMIRNADAMDLPAIVDIYNAAIPGRLATADTEPVSLDSRRSWFQDRDFRKHPIWVYEGAGNGKPIVGWLSFKPFYGRPAYAATAEVSIYVDPSSHRSGVATRLMEHAIAHASALQLTTYLAFVFAHNAPSLAFCRKFGFAQWGHLPRIAVLDGVDRDLLILGRRL